MMRRLIEEVDWNEFEKFPGSSPLKWDISSDLQALKSNDSAVRKKAMDFFRWAWSEEGVGDVGRLGALPQVIDILTKYLQDSAIRRRGELINVIYWLCQGVRKCARFTALYEGTPQTLVGAAQEAFEQGLPSYVEFLDASDAEVRKSSARVLGFSRDRRVGTKLISRLQAELDSEVIQEILASLGWLKVEDALEILPRYLDSNILAVRVRAAGADCLIRQSPSQSSVAILAETIVLGAHWDLASVPANLNEFEFAIYNSDIRNYASSVISRLGATGLALALDYWSDRVGNVEDDQIINYLDFMILALWDLTEGYGRAKREKLTAHQRRGLKLVLDCDEYWTTTTMLKLARTPTEKQRRVDDIKNTVSLVLEDDLGIPGTREGLRRFLEIDQTLRVE